MRRMWAVAVIGVSLLLAWPLAAQQGGSNFFTGMQPRTITFKKIDVTKTLTPKGGAATAGFYRKPPSLAAPNLTGFLPSLNTLNPLTWASRRVATPAPLTKNPFQPTPPAGTNPFAPPTKK